MTQPAQPEAPFTWKVQFEQTLFSRNTVNSTSDPFEQTEQDS